MGDRNITLFALHTHGDTQFGPSSIPGVDEAEAPDVSSKAKSWFGSDEESGAEETDIDVSSAEDEEADGSKAALLVALVVLVGIAMVAKRLTGGEETEVDVAESDDL